MGQPTEDQLGALITGMREALDDIEHGILDRSQVDRRKRKRWSLRAVDLLRRAQVRPRDGYPTSSGFDRQGGSSNAEPDRIGEIVVADTADMTFAAWLTVIGGLRSAANYLDRCVSELAKASPREPASPRTVCRACGGWLSDEERRRYTDRCTWCHGWWLNHGTEVPEVVLEARRQGRRITTGLLREAGVLDKGRRRESFTPQ